MDARPTGRRSACGSGQRATGGDAPENSEASFRTSRGRTDSGRNGETVPDVAESLYSDATIQSALALVSHELRTPLIAMLGYLDEGLRGVEEPAALESLTTARAQGEYLLRLIESVLDSSRLRSGRFALSPANVRANELAAEVVRAMGGTARTRGISLTWVPDEEEPELYVDPDRVREVLLNLIGNAIKFTEVGGVELRVLSSGTAVIFEVVDQGIGIPETRLTRVFHPFRQADRSTHEKFGGSGLGLTISQDIVEQMGGWIDVDSVLGAGSTFRVVLPVEAGTDLERIDDAIEGSAPREADGEENRSESMVRNARVLIAEDDPVQAKLLERILNSLGCRVVCVRDGIEASRALLSAQASGEGLRLVLVDLHLPSRDGCDVLRRCRSTGYDGAVIAMTASATGPDRDRAEGAGFDEVLGKPLRRAQLVALLDRWVDPEDLRPAS